MAKKKDDDPALAKEMPPRRVHANDRPALVKHGVPVEAVDNDELLAQVYWPYYEVYQRGSIGRLDVATIIHIVVEYEKALAAKGLQTKPKEKPKPRSKPKPNGEAMQETGMPNAKGQAETAIAAQTADADDL